MLEDSIRSMLKEKVVSVTFTKKNGEERVMLCTLMEDFIPKVTGTSVPVDGIITVYDIENEGWRSFREDSIISYEEVKY